jgi:dethiobiotin synthetase/adenosylmethionine--8-amino-7-oxononanoate aminotransferase
MALAIIETAGGVLSPAPSGTPQADLYRPMRLPVVLVGDHKLGGIGSTISAAESLIVRGYDIDSVICFDDKSKYENSAYLQDYFAKMGIHTSVLPWIPDFEGASEKEEAEMMTTYYQDMSRRRQLYAVADRIETMHMKRLSSLNTMAPRTKDIIWHPFTQHKHVENADDVLVFDSACGDYFQVKRTDTSLQDVQQKDDAPLLYPAFDGSASWWTQVSFVYTCLVLGLTDLIRRGLGTETHGLLYKRLTRPVDTAMSCLPAQHTSRRSP